MPVETNVEALGDQIEFFRSMPEVTNRAAMLAINQVASRGGLALARKMILDQINFPDNYLNGDRLRVSKRAKPGDLEATIVGRQRATSLARFASGQPIGSQRGPNAGVRVSVKQGSTVSIKNAWLVRLRRGASLDEDNYNVGLAVRVGPSGNVGNKKTKHRSWLVPGVIALLYGPSVDQIFRDVAGDISKPVLDMVSDEFFRQFSRLS